jgi:cysteine desulfurase/selenocysteine lyase
MSEVITTPKQSGQQSGAGALDVDTLRSQFPVLDQDVNGHRMVYLDSAATAQRPTSVIDAVSAFYREDNANVHRGIYELSRRATEAFEEARRVVAASLNAGEAEEVVWVRGTTEAINLVASTWGPVHVGQGDEIVLTMLEHHSNIIPWQLLAGRVGAKLRYVDIDDEGRLRLDQLDELLTPRTRLVAVGHVSNALGTVNPVADIVERAHAAGARVLVDGAQGAPHLPVDVQAMGCDFYAISGHKMCGPMGIGALWARRELLEEMPPYQGGGEMINTVDLEHATWADVPHKFEAGTPNVAGAVGMAAAVRFLDDVGRAAIEAHEHDLIEHGLEQLAAAPGVRLFGPTSSEDRTAVFSFELEGVHPHDVATILDAEGVAVRAGHHCTQPLMRRLGVPATTRASCYLYNTVDELDRLADALERARKIFA